MLLASSVIFRSPISCPSLIFRSDDVGVKSPLYRIQDVNLHKKRCSLHPESRFSKYLRQGFHGRTQPVTTVYASLRSAARKRPLDVCSHPCAMFPAFASPLRFGRLQEDVPRTSATPGSDLLITMQILRESRFLLTFDFAFCAN